MVAAKAEDVVATLSAEAKQRQREAGAQYGENHPKEVRQEIAEALPVPDENKTVAKAAKLFGTNRTYVNQAKRLIEEAPDLAEQVERGELKITQAASTLRKRKSEEISADRQQQQAESWKVDTYGSVEELRMTGKTFDVIYADPPWRYGNQATRAATDNHYPTMTVEEIAELPVRDISNDKSLLFLWTTNGFLFESRLVIESWGFTFKSSMVWVKPQIGIGNYVRNSHEFLLICSRGGAIPNGSSQISWLECNRTKHSKKPDQFRIVIEQMTKGSSRVELFGREVFEGWITVGNQIERNLIHAG
jgi:N6-adenosine-specific RNA methylase IME4